jgi:hypothetical protein
LEFRIWNAGHEFQIPTSKFPILQRALNHGRWLVADGIGR